jgi:class 3 adenylate cyclase
MKSRTFIQLGDSPASAKLAGELVCKHSEFRPSHPSTQTSADQTSGEHDPIAEIDGSRPARGGNLALESVQRRLTAILAADVAGYSRLMGLDEAGTARTLQEHRAAVDPVVAHHGGRIVKTTGDGVLLEFPSIVAAVDCAVVVQNLMRERNSDVPEERRMLFRIGINLGDVLIDGDDILGDGVNIAARLEGIAEPGGICVSDDVYRQVSGKLDVSFEDMGNQQLKKNSASGACLSGTFCRSSCKPDVRIPPTATRQTLHCCSAIHQHERRSGAGLLCRWNGR